MNIIYRDDENDSYKYNISITPLPENCGVCPFYLRKSGHELKACIFGSINSWGNLIKRALDCPLDKN